MSCRILAGLMLIAALSMAASSADAKEEKEVEVNLSDCPSAVRKTLKREAHGAMLEEVEKEVEHGKTIYEADVEIDDKDYEIRIAKDGTLICKCLDEDDENEEDEKEEEHEEDELELSDCPSAVRKTMKREALGAKIKEIEKEVENGKTVYEADTKIDGRNYEITVAKNGTLISKALDEDEDEEDDDDDE